ncbi:MAG: hypothetical protein QM778_23450 [Myxococcales bacterium]
MPPVHTRLAFRVWTCLLLSFLAGCSDGLKPTDLGWSVSFACESDRARADQVALRVMRGSCSGKQVYSAMLMRGESAPGIKELAAGRYGFEAVASVGGGEVARGCVVGNLPAKAPIVTLLTSDACDQEGMLLDSGSDLDSDGGSDGGTAGDAGPDGGDFVLDCSHGCDDGNACTSDQCIDNKCVSFAFSATLECDRVLCTLGDVCEKGRCISGDANDSFCKDEEVCTQEVCLVGVGCTSMPVEGDCDDPAPCISGEKCQYGRCWGQSTCGADQVCDRELNQCVSCTKDGQCDDNDPCTLDDCSCDTPDCQGGLCTHTPAEEGASCDDGIMCTSEDVCMAGVCAGAPQDGSCTDNNDCTLDTCQQGKGCVFTKSSDPELACTDLQDCTSGDHCANGTCVGSENCDGQEFCGPTGRCVECVENSDCDNSNVCVTQTCVEGMCVSKFNNGASCQDPYKCTTGDFCQDGACLTGPGRDHNQCKDTVACTEDLCNPPSADGCTHQFKDGLTCDDGIGCTGPDVCSGGKCIGPDACPGDPVCDPVLKICATCQKALDCDDKKPCTKDECTNGACVNTPLTTGPGGCNDNTECSKNDRCQNGVCIADADNDFCGDGSEPDCTTDTCVPGSGGKGCVSAFNTNSCDDGKACTSSSTCNQGNCLPDANSSTCGANAICDDTGTCQCTVAGEQRCGSSCVDVQTSNQNCGGCNNPCGANRTCVSGACMPTNAIGECVLSKNGTHDYLTCNGPLKWSDARARCKAYGGFDLAVVNNVGENGFLNQIVGGTEAWFGANDRGDNGGPGWPFASNGCDSNHPSSGEGSWYWISPGADSEEGLLFCQQPNPGDKCGVKNSAYLSWNDGEPNNSGCSCSGSPLTGGSCKDAEDCGAFLQGGKWNDADCTLGKRYICESY